MNLHGFHMYLLSSHYSRQTGFSGEKFQVSWSLSSIGGDRKETNKYINGI